MTFPESLKLGERENHPIERTGPTREQLATDPVPPACRRGQQIPPRSSFPAHGPVPGPKHPISLQDVPCGTCPSKRGLKRRFKLTFPSFFSQFPTLVTLCMSPTPTLATQKMFETSQFFGNQPLTRTLPKKVTNALLWYRVRQCKGWTGMLQNVSMVWHKDFCNPTKDQGWLCLLQALRVSIPC